MIVTIVFGLILLITIGLGSKSKTKRPFMAFSLPVILWLVIGSILPFITTAIISFTDMNGVSLSNGTWRFYGIHNFINILHGKDNVLAVWRTAEFTLISVFIEMILGILLGLFFYWQGNRIRYARYIFIIPVIIPPIIAGMIWRAIFDRGFGLLNFIFKSIGFESQSWLSLKVILGAGSKVFFGISLGELLNLRSGFGAAMTAEVWQWTPFIAVITYTVLMTISRELLEWARSEGIQGIRLIRHILLPSAIPIIVVVGLLRFVDCLKTYESIWSLFENNILTANVNIRIATYALVIRNYGQGASFTILALVLVSVGGYWATKTILGKTKYVASK